MAIERSSAPGTNAPMLTLPLAPEWKDQQRLWGHSFHPMCSYLGSFPAALAHAFIARWSRPGDVVLDPFSGRGTVPLQACAERRIGVGIDANPLASLLTGAKVDPPTRTESTARLDHLRIDWSFVADDWLALALAAIEHPEQALVPTPAGESHRLEPISTQVARSFHPRTLAQLLYLRSVLRLDARVDRFVAAAIVGILHGRSASYLSTAMPNAFSLAPAYSARYLAGRDHQPPDRDVFALLVAKLKRLYRDGSPPTRGFGLDGDASDAVVRVRARLRATGAPDRARLVVTSPPYLGTVRYGRYNWLRLWFLGHDPAMVDATLTASREPSVYARFLGDVLDSLRPGLTEDAIVVLVIGDVATDRGRPHARPRTLAETVWADAAEPAGYRLVGVSADAVASHHKLTRMWGAEAGQATSVDRILVIAPTEIGRRRALASVATPVDWGQSNGRRRPTILAPYAADVSPRRPRGDGSARSHEEPRPRADDQPTAELHPAAAGPSVRP